MTIKICLFSFSRASVLHTNKPGFFTEEKRQYYDTLNTQCASRENETERARKDDTEEQIRHFQNWESFWGRPGYGAPVRTRSGRVRTAVLGNPEIRFQENASVQKSIFNAIRYQSNPELKQQYQRDLGKEDKHFFPENVFWIKTPYSFLFRGANQTAQRDREGG